MEFPPRITRSVIWSSSKETWEESKETRWCWSQWCKEMKPMVINYKTCKKIRYKEQMKKRRGIGNMNLN